VIKPSQGGGMLVSRTTGSASVVPELVYADVAEAIVWLCDAFGFTEIWRAGGHRARLAYGNGVVIIADDDPGYGRVTRPAGAARSCSVMVKVDDVDAHYDHARRRGALILRPPADCPYGERRYSAHDLAGHTWNFTEAFADLAPRGLGRHVCSHLTDGSWSSFRPRQATKMKPGGLTGSPLVSQPRRRRCRLSL
jgi:uncharacterized glyoxalase superfamily protein PhnB